MIPETPVQSSVTPIPGVHDFSAISATSAAAAGVAVIPLRPGTKRPLYATGGGHLDGALRNPQAVLDEAANLIAKYGEPHGWGIVTGRLLVVLDLDGDTAAHWFNEFVEQHPEVAAWASSTVRVRTALGIHLYGTVPDGAPVHNSAGKLGPGVDVRGAGGYVVAPGTRHPSGTRYTLDTNAEANALAAAGDPDALLALFHDMSGEGDDFAVASLAALRVPEVLLDLMLDDDKEVESTAVHPARLTVSEATARRRFEGLVRTVQTVERGQGNAALNRAAGVAAALGFERAEVEQRLVEAYLSRSTSESLSNRRREALATIASGYRWGSDNPDEALRERQSTGANPSKPKAPPRYDAPTAALKQAVESRQPPTGPATHDERRARERAAHPQTNPEATMNDDETDAAEGAANVTEHEQQRAAVRCKFPLVDLAALVDPERPPRQWVWGEVVPVGEHVSIFAPAGLGKSLLVLALALAAARGARDFIGRRVELPAGARVLYIDMENSDDDHAERFVDLGVTPETVGQLSERLLMLSLPPLRGLDTEQGATELWAILDAYGIGEGDLLVLDSTQRVTEGEENSADTFRQLYNLTSRELKRRGITVIRTDNTGHSGDRARGSSGKRDDVGASWSLQQDGRDLDVFSLVPTKRRSKGRSGALSFRRTADENGLLVFEPEAGSFGDIMSDIRDLLNRLGVPTNAGQRKAWEAVKAERERALRAGEEFPEGTTSRLVMKAQAERDFSIELVSGENTEVSEA